MTSKLPTDSKSLYETDYSKWIETTIGQLRSQDFLTVDWKNLIEELEDVGRSERRSLESNLVVLLLHLLKWQYQPELRNGSWKGSIVEHRRRIRKALKDSPSLKSYLEEILAECYVDAVEQAIAETGLSPNIFSPACPYSTEAILETKFMPE